jgi:hypothetical protein
VSENILQIYTANPATSMQSTDLLYLGRSPYNTSDDFAITFANFVASVSGSFTWVGVSGTTQAAAVNNGYIIQSSTQTNVTLPATAAIGSRVAIRGLGAGGWILTANTGQTIKVDGATTSSGGSLTSSGQYDSIDVTCVVANTTWVASSLVSMGLTYA